MSFSLNVYGLQGLRSDTARRLSMLRNKRGVYLAAATVLKQWVLRNFQADGKLHDESKYYWPPLSEYTIQKRRKGRGAGVPQILRDTGRLRAGFETGADQRHGWIVNRVEYSVIHEFGKQGKPRIPQRKMFPTEDQARKIVLPVLESHVARAIR